MCTEPSRGGRGTCANLLHPAAGFGASWWGESGSSWDVVRPDHHLHHLPGLRLCRPLLRPLWRLRVEGAVDFLKPQTEPVGEEAGVVGPPAARRPPGPHLAGVQPVLQPAPPADARQCQAEEGVLTQRAEQSAAQAQAQQHEEAGEVIDAHLQGLGAAQQEPLTVM